MHTKKKIEIQELRNAILAQWHLSTKAENYSFWFTDMTVNYVITLSENNGTRDVLKFTITIFQLILLQNFLLHLTWFIIYLLNNQHQILTDRG